MKVKKPLGTLFAFQLLRCDCMMQSQNNHEESFLKVVSIQKFKQIRDKKHESMMYRVQLAKMDKSQLLQELLNYHENYRKNPKDVNITLRAQQLVEILEQRAELEELRELSREFQVKLKARLYQQMS